MKCTQPITIDGQTFQVEIEDLNTRPIVVYVDGERFEVWPDGQELETTPVIPPVASSPTPLTPAPAPPPASGPIASAVRAPIPGVIVAVLVRPGDAIAHGQELFTIEAMKMRNAIRSTRAGKAGDVLVTQGQTVNHHDLLMTYAESEK